MLPTIDLRSLTDPKLQELISPVLPGSAFLIAAAFSWPMKTESVLLITTVPLFVKIIVCAISAYVVGVLIFWLAAIVDAVALNITSIITFRITAKQKFHPAEDHLWRNAVSLWLDRRLVPSVHETAKEVGIRYQARVAATGNQEPTPVELNEQFRAGSSDIAWQRLYSALNAYFGFNGQVQPNILSGATMAHSVLLAMLFIMFLPIASHASWSIWLIILVVNISMPLLVALLGFSANLATRNVDLQTASVLQAIQHQAASVQSKAAAS